VRSLGVGIWRMSQALEPSELNSVLFYVGKGKYVNTLAIPRPLTHRPSVPEFFHFHPDRTGLAHQGEPHSTP